MSTKHNNAKKGDIANIVIMPGDPLRAKMIADKYLTNVVQINTVRNMFGYTGYYKDKKITVMGSGMGIPSMGIYSYELYKFYDVDTIIRIGSAGSNHPDVKVLDVVLAESSYSLSTFAYLFNGDESKIMYSDSSVNEKILETAKKKGTEVKFGPIITSDIFDVYLEDLEKYENNYPRDLNTLISEMEAFALFFNAKILGKKAACLATVVDSKYDEYEVSTDDRQNSLLEMIELALDSCL